MSDAPRCPTCEQPLAFAGFFRMCRDDDSNITCRVAWSCTARHYWWRWADRADRADQGTPLEACPPGLLE